MINAVKVQRIIEIEVPGLGEQIKKARQQQQQAGKTMTELAGGAGMSVQNWYRIEKESQTLAEDVLKKIEDALGVSFGVKFDE